MQKQRILVWFSCGAPSAVMAKEAVRRYGDVYDVQIVNCDTRPSENSDNYRFSREVEHWVGRQFTYIRNSKFETVDDVFEKTRYMSGVKGARCTTELKKIPRLQFSLPDDIHSFGFTMDEAKRTRDFRMRNPELRLKWILIESGFTKRMCLQEIERAGIVLPEMYRLGFDNNNCPGCVKSSSPWYWSKIRKLFPAVFKIRCEQSRKLGVRLIEYKGNRIFLDELPAIEFKKRGKKENLSCGPECGEPGL